MTTDVFAVPIFFICFRECVETSIIVSVLLAFIKQTLGSDTDAVTRKKLIKQVWWGVAIGLFICLCIGGGMIGAFYGYGKDHFASTEDLWEGIFALVAAVIITVMGAALLRVNKLQEKWRVKLAQALEAKPQPQGRMTERIKHWSQKYFMFILPLITVLREGLEAVVFIGGVSLSFPASAFPLPVFTGLLAGVVVGYIIYRGGNQTSLQIFMVISTCLLYLVAAGLLSRGVWFLENNTWSNLIGGDASETGAGPGSYDIRQSVWHVNCCSPLVNGGGGWGIFNAILGWQNSATYGSIISYNLYWLVVIVWFVMMRYREQQGRWLLINPLVRRLKTRKANECVENLESTACTGVLSGNKAPGNGVMQLQATEV
ncbi:plasma membrane iron permease [Aspergillus bombycis]|uniref:Plasma membrane iron permease n=1 Tax=Aspergillus bombycis TaxID=109264 RepID=A0A1F7ZVS6_9EURO|nr:plasma membrane iron permease [Aspergillus bombycis]OGM43582.1 plasma membrane iron permease [Aspergillus bombycis]